MKKPEAMRKGGKIIAEIHEILMGMISKGVSELEIENKAKSLCKKYNVIPGFLGYEGYPAATCICVNDEVVHAIPSNYRFKTGDVVTIDFGIVFNGYNLDMARTVVVGKTQTNDIIEVSKTALKLATAICKNGVRVGDIGEVIQDYVESHGYAIIRELVGHSIGRHLHEAPYIPNFGNKGTGAVLKKGDTIAIEVIISEGSGEIVIAEDDWTVLTDDGSIGVATENTIMVGSSAPEVLTIR
ncbi:type I methionyl aminopeptidase [Candidatus Dojkabacteria bacterium]|nr:type I methionyl aminopeptidase [Candidatus Dojkabacteria bacterium]